MASITKVHMTRVRLKNRNAGRKRKNQLNNRGTTPTWETFFGEAGQADAASSSASAKPAAKSHGA